MYVTRSIFFMALALGVAACADPVASPETPVRSGHAGPSIDPGLAASDAAVVAAAVGAAHRDALGRPVVLNFSAVQHADGRVQGSYYFQSVANHASIHVDVTCMSVVGNGAWVAGIITKSNIPAFIGTVSYFYTFDEGEGADATDIVSLTRANDIPGEDLLFCRDRPTLLPSRDVLHGNVNVMGG